MFGGEHSSNAEAAEPGLFAVTADVLLTTN
jgi:hypothetical protein